MCTISRSSWPDRCKRHRRALRTTTPQSDAREAADHSLPFIIAAVLIDGRYSDEIYSSELLRDPRIHRLASRISVKEDPELTQRFPRDAACRIEVATKSGQHKTAAVDSPRGHVNNPMTDDEVNAKFRSLAGRVLSKEHVERALERLWAVDEAADLGAIFEAVQVGGKPR